MCSHIMRVVLCIWQCASMAAWTGVSIRDLSPSNWNILELPLVAMAGARLGKTSSPRCLKRKLFVLFGPNLGISYITVLVFNPSTISTINQLQELVFHCLCWNTEGSRWIKGNNNTSTGWSCRSTEHGKNPSMPSGIGSRQVLRARHAW